jgi:hypothetical protein
MLQRAPLAAHGPMRYQRVILGRDGLLNYEAPGPWFILDPGLPLVPGPISRLYSGRFDTDRCSNTPTEGEGARG